MSDVIGQPIEDIITLVDDDNIAIEGLTRGDFETLEAFSVNAFGTLVPVSELLEFDEGQYRTKFTPPIGGKWALHYIYRTDTIFRQETFIHDVSASATINVITAGGDWTYDGDLDDPLQEVRFLIQDTDGSNPIFTDNEVSFGLGFSGGHTRKAASYLVQRLMARFAAMADTTELDLSVRASQIYDHYKDLLAMLNSPFATNGSVVPYASGISNSDILANQANVDRKVGIFDRNIYSPWRYR